MTVSKLNLVARLQQWMYPSMPDLSLGIIRALFFGTYFLFILPTDFAGYATFPPELISPSNLLYYFPQLHLSYDHFLIVTYFWKISLLLASLGLFTKITSWLAAVGSLYVFGWPIAYIPSDYMYQTPVLAMVVLATSSCGLRFSLDSLFWKKNTSFSDQKAGFYIKFVQFLVCLMYFKAGVAKLRLAGIAWLTDGHLMGHLKTAFKHYETNYSELGLYLYSVVIERPELVQIASAAALTIELTSLLPLLFIRLIPFYLILWLTFHISIYLLMGIYSSYWLLPLLAFFIPWDKIMSHKEGIA